MKKGLIFGAIGALALAFTACSNDEPTGYQDEKVDRDQTQYLSVAICNPTNYMSRAGEFENGAIAESAVKSLYFVFYDGSGAPITTHSINSFNADDWTDNPTGNNVTRIYSSVIPVEMAQGQNKPVYVMCFVNPIDETKLNTATLEEIDAAVRNQVVKENFFAMSNSVYYGNNPITGQTNVRMMATPIVEGQLYKTFDEAKNGEAIVEIYVERYAAKIGVEMAATFTNPGYPVYDAATGETTVIKFTPEFWHPNAMDMTTYITKGFSTSPVGSSSVTAASFNDMTTNFQNTGMPGNGINGWNDPTNFRSYWSCSPSYYANEYPECSDNITDVWSSADGSATYPYAVKYFSYQEAKDGFNEDADDVRESGFTAPGIAWNNGFSYTENATTGWFYARETTASSQRLTAEGLNNKAVPASVVIVGKYQLDGATGNPSTFYLYGKNQGTDVYYGTPQAVEQALIANQNVIFINQNLTTKATSTDCFVVEHPSMDVRTTDGKVQNVAGRLVTLQIDPESLTALKNAGTTLYFYNGTAAVEVTTDNVVAANKLLWASASTAQMFGDGMAFFSIPVRHLGWGVNVDDNKPLSSKNENGVESINWANLRPGDLGIVRNHVYRLQITGIQGLGIGLRDEDQPMVPPMDPDNYYVSAKLNILAWRIVPTQSGIVL